MSKPTASSGISSTAGRSMATKAIPVPAAIAVARCVGSCSPADRPFSALSAALVGELAAALDKLEEDTAIGAIVLTGNEKAFAAGADVKEMVGKSYPEIYCEDFITRGGGRVAQGRTPA